MLQHVLTSTMLAWHLGITTNHPGTSSLYSWLFNFLSCPTLDYNSFITAIDVQPVTNSIQQGNCQPLNTQNLHNNNQTGQVATVSGCHKEVNQQGRTHVS